MIGDLLPRYLEAYGDKTSYAIERSIVIDGHETAWMRMQGTVLVDLMNRGREGEPWTAYGVKCECDFVEGVGWKMTDTGPVGLSFAGSDPRGCLYRATAVHLRHLELRSEYLARFGDQWGGDTVPRKAIPDVILDLIERRKHEEWLGEDPGGATFWGGYFYLQTVAAITNHFIGHLWEDVYKLMADKKIGLEGAVIQPYHDPPPPEWVEHMRLEEDGWVVTASLPGNRDMAREWKFEVLRPDGEPGYAFLPGLGLMHEYLFGPDVEDVERAQAHARRLLAQARKPPEPVE